MKKYNLLIILCALFSMILQLISHRSEAKIINSDPFDSIQVVQDSVTMSAADIVQKQLEAYNAKDLEAFLSLYSDNVKGFNFPDKEIFSGKNAMRAGYEALFKDNPDLQCVVLQRTVMNNVVVDHEKISGLSNANDVNTIAIFKIEKGKINRIYFIRN